MMSDSSSTASKKSVRNCPNCKSRMSGKEFDPHIICISCRGKDCDSDTRCDICIKWSDHQMAQYLKHQASLKRKRVSKEKAKLKQHPVDLATLCTGLPDVDVILPDDGASGDGAASVSSVAGSASGVNLLTLLDDRVKTVESNLDDKLHSFGVNFLDLMNQQFSTLRADFLEMINPSLTAPDQVRGQPLDKRPSDPDPDLLQGLIAMESGRRGPCLGDL